MTPIWIEITAHAESAAKLELCATPDGGGHPATPIPPHGIAVAHATPDGGERRATPEDVGQASRLSHPNGAVRLGGARPRRQRPEEARRPDARPLSPAAAGREDGVARPDDLRHRPRAEQPARDDPHVVRAPVAAPGGRRDAARPGRHPRRIGARGPHRAQPPHLRAQAPHHAHDGGPQSRRQRDARAARLRAARDEHHRARPRSPPACRRSSPIRTSSSRSC